MGYGQTIVNGLLLGGLYAIVGVGMSVLFGIVRLTNLAHGEFVILASYVSMAFVAALGAHPLVTLILVIPVMFVLGFALQMTLINRLLPRGAEPPLLVMFGLSIIIQNLLLQVFTSDAQHLHSAFDSASVSLGNIRLPVMYLIDCLAGVLVIIVLNLFMKRSYMGKAIRAASDDRVGAQLMGVNIKTAYGIAAGVALATAAVSGVLVGMTYNFYPTTGSTYLIISFGVVVIGGMGSILGTMVAGFIFGLAQLIGGALLGTGVQMLAGYIVILIMLILRPQGLFSK